MSDDHQQRQVTTKAEAPISVETRWTLWLKYNATVLVAIAVYFSYGSMNVAQKKQDIQTQNGRVSLVASEISLTPISESEVRLHAQFKNISNRSVESYALLPFAFDIKTREVKQLANISGATPMQRDASFEIDTILKRTDLLSVLTLC